MDDGRNGGGCAPGPELYEHLANGGRVRHRLGDPAVGTDVSYHLRVVSKTLHMNMTVSRTVGSVGATSPFVWKGTPVTSRSGSAELEKAYSINGSWLAAGMCWCICAKV